MRKIIFFNIVALIIFLIDRFLKSLFYHAERGFLFFRNYQLAFSLPFSKNILITLIIIILFFLLFFLVKSYKKKNYSLFIALIFIIFGTISNLIDRLTFGFVIDYINIPFFTAFNLADIMIVGGIFYAFKNIFLRS